MNIEQIIKEQREKYEDSFFSKYHDEKEKLNSNTTEIEAIGFIEKMISLSLECPFCGSIPKYEYRVGNQDKTGSTIHTVERYSCCGATSNKLELFFCNDFKPPQYGLWAKQAFWLVCYWNTRNFKKEKEFLSTIKKYIELLDNK